MTYDARPIVRWCPHADCVKTKSRHYGNLFLLWKMSRMMLLILQSIKVFVCPILRSHGNRQPHFMIFKCWFKGWYSTGISYRFVSTPGTVASFISRKTWVQLADLPNVRWERSVFSAPRQRMSVVEGREVIVINIKKIREVIIELSIYFFPTEHPDSVWLAVPWQWPESDRKVSDRKVTGLMSVPRSIYTGLSCGSLCSSKSN